MEDNLKPDVSVIIPVYCVEDYLDKCVKSIINQTHRNIEVILVDDGSPDRSGLMCDEYSKADCRVKVIHKKNGGLSDARNKGIEAATGKYILFVDSDDYIEKDAIEKLFKHSEDYDLEVLNANAYQTSDDNLRTLYSGDLKDEIVDGITYLANTMENKKYLAAVWLRLYRTDLIKNNNLYFKVGLLHEDEQWTPYMLLNARRVGYIDYTFYYYVIRSGSITQMKNREKHIKDVISTCYELIDHITKMDLCSHQMSIIKDYFARLYMNTAIYGKFNSTFYKNTVNRRFPLKNSYYTKSKIQALIFAINFKMFRILKSKTLA
jgi:glycosyltransferase involved in cell wall biosynthesis